MRVTVKLKILDPRIGREFPLPGHATAGAAGMELLLLVVDAGEGVMPQTLEHLAILQFLDVRRIIVVASKIDLIESAQREAAYRRIEQRLRVDEFVDPEFKLPRVAAR